MSKDDKWIYIYYILKHLDFHVNSFFVRVWTRVPTVHSCFDNGSHPLCGGIHVYKEGEVYGGRKAPRVWELAF